MIPCQEDLKIFEDLAKEQFKVKDRKRGVVIKNEKGVERPNLPAIRTALRNLIKFYRPHHIDKPTYHRWSFGIVYELDREHCNKGEEDALGINLVIQWHKEPSGMQWLQIYQQRKTWPKGHYPPCLWNS